MATALSNQIRGVMKTFGLVVPKASSRNVGAWLGLTPRRCQSGEVDYDGHISRRGDGRLRALLYRGRHELLTRIRADSALRRWGLVLKKRLGFKRAAVALAQKDGRCSSCSVALRYRVRAIARSGMTAAIII